MPSTGGEGLREGEEEWGVEKGVQSKFWSEGDEDAWGKVLYVRFNGPSEGSGEKPQAYNEEANFSSPPPSPIGTAGYNRLHIPSCLVAALAGLLLACRPLHLLILYSHSSLFPSQPFTPLYSRTQTYSPLFPFTSSHALSHVAFYLLVSWKFPPLRWHGWVHDVQNVQRPKCETSKNKWTWFSLGWHLLSTMALQREYKVLPNENSSTFHFSCAHVAQLSMGVQDSREPRCTFTNYPADTVKPCQVLAQLNSSCLARQPSHNRSIALDIPSEYTCACAIFGRHTCLARFCKNLFYTVSGARATVRLICPQLGLVIEWV